MIQNLFWDFLFINHKTLIWLDIVNVFFVFSCTNYDIIVPASCYFFQISIFFNEPNQNHYLNSILMYNIIIFYNFTSIYSVRGLENWDWHIWKQLVLVSNNISTEFILVQLITVAFIIIHKIFGKISSIISNLTIIKTIG